MTIYTSHEWTNVFLACVILLLVAALIWVVRENRRLQSHAMIDGVTGLLNRFAAQMRLQELEDDAKRHKYCLGVFFVDLDRFKLINDTHGHHFGDTVLSAVGDLLMSHMRRSDMIGRWGGEEFLVVGRIVHTEETPMTRALVVAERIRAATEALKPKGVVVTASVGVAVFDPATHSSIADAVRRADRALYGAKESGRNKVVAAAPDA